MVKNIRVTYHKQSPYRTKGNKIKVVKTPGGKLVAQYLTKRVAGVHCGDCGGRLHAFDISDSTIEPPKLWEIDLGGCIESTPALWRGQIVVGTRGGFVYAVGDPLG